MRKVLVTGGAGFIGCHIVELLLQEGVEVCVLDSLSPQIHPRGNPGRHFQPLLPHLKFIRGDIRDDGCLDAALDGVDAIVHLAAETGTGQSMYEISRYVSVNELGTARLLEKMAAHQAVEKLVIGSSRAVYGEGKFRCPAHGIYYPKGRSEQKLAEGFFELYCPDCEEELLPLATDEDAPVNPKSVYGLTKFGQESLCLQFGNTFHTPVVALRYQNVYGPGQSLANPYTGILAIFSTRFRMGKEVLVFEDGLESRDFVYVSDVAQATVGALKSEAAKGEVLNIGTGLPVSVMSVAEKLRALINPQGGIRVTGQYRVGDIRHNFADSTKAQRLLEFVPQIDFDEGLQLFVDWVLGSEMGEDRLQASLEELQARGLLK